MAESHDLARFELADMVVLGRSLRHLARGCESVEELAVRLTDHLYDAFAEPGSGARQTVLVRCYLTVDQRSAAVLTGGTTETASSMPGQPATSRYLALLASRGRLTEWNDRRCSAGHQAIPLSAAALAVSPMISALLDQLGVDLGALSATGESVITDPDDVHFGVFHVEDAVGSAYVPAQDFVSAHGVRSALGFGGLLPDGSVFAVVMFTGVRVPAAAATLFRTVSLSVRLALLELDGVPLVAAGGSDTPEGEPPAATRRKPHRMRKLRAERAMLEQLVRVHENTTLAEATRAAEALKRWQREAERSSTLARTLQRSLLPAALPELAGVSVAGIFRPAGDGSEIGGDFYDVFTVGDASAWFVVGDVSGKGAGAAALTSVARSTLRAVSSGSLATPLSCLRSLNDAVLAHDADRHLTAVVGRLRTEASVLHVTLALAGHPPALLLPANGPLRTVGVPGTALGMFETIDVTEVRVDLGPGDILLAFTDGVTEARNRCRELYGDDRLAELVLRLRGHRPAELTRTIAQAVLDYQGDWAADDIALLALGPSLG